MSARCDACLRTLWLRATKSRAAESKDDDLACASVGQCPSNCSRKPSDQALCGSEPQSPVRPSRRTTTSHAPELRECHTRVFQPKALPAAAARPLPEVGSTPTAEWLPRRAAREGSVPRPRHTIADLVKVPAVGIQDVNAGLACDCELRPVGSPDRGALRRRSRRTRSCPPSGSRRVPPVSRSESRSASDRRSAVRRRPGWSGSFRQEKPASAAVGPDHIERRVVPRADPGCVDDVSAIRRPGRPGGSNPCAQGPMAGSVERENRDEVAHRNARARPARICEPRAVRRPGQLGRRPAAEPLLHLHGVGAPGRPGENSGEHLMGSGGLLRFRDQRRGGRRKGSCRRSGRERRRFVAHRAPRRD